MDLPYALQLAKVCFQIVWSEVGLDATKKFTKVEQKSAVSGWKSIFFGETLNLMQLVMFRLSLAHSAQNELIFVRFW